VSRFGNALCWWATYAAGISFYIFQGKIEYMATVIKLFKKEQVGEVLQRLRDSGIDLSLSLISGGEFDITIGPLDQKEYKHTLDRCRIDWSKIEEVVSAMAYEAATAHPESDFSFWYDRELASVKIEKSFPH
jgi:hypothetical protein